MENESKAGDQASVTVGRMLEGLKRDIADFIKSSKKEEKDNWDKAGVIAQFIAGVLIGTLTLFVSCAGQRISKSVQNAQIESTERQLTAAYMKEIANEHDANRRAELLGAMDLSVRAKDAIPIAVHYAVRTRKPPFKQGPNSDPVYVSSIQVLRRLARVDKTTLESMKTLAAPDSDIVSAILGENIHVRVRVSGVDDKAVFTVNNRQLLALTFGQDSGWVDITDALTNKANSFQLVVSNGTGGSGARIEISAGIQQYDSGGVRCDPSPEDTASFLIRGGLEVEDKADRDDSVRVFLDGPYFYKPGGGFALECALTQFR